MRHLLACCLSIVFSTTSGLAAADAIVVAAARVEIVSARSDLQKVCGSDRWIYGCTKFRGERLFCNCTRADDGWRVEATAQFIPYIYLWQAEAMGHEKLHIEDIRASAAEYVKELTSTQFPAAVNCERAARDAEKGFTRQMDRWKKASNVKRHPH